MDGTPLVSPRKPTEGGGDRSNRGGRRDGSRCRVARCVLRPCTEGRLRMLERKHAVGSCLVAFPAHFFSSGSRQIGRPIVEKRDGEDKSAATATAAGRKRR